VPKIFISYRRKETTSETGRIYDRLTRQFGEDNIFRDVDDIPIGVDFRVHIDKAIGNCQLVLAIIGKGWGTKSAGAMGSGDFVRIELESALRREIPVVPILVNEAEMPSAEDLPEGLKEFAYFNAVEIDSGRDFNHHVDRLITGLSEILSKTEAEQDSEPLSEHLKGLIKGMASDGVISRQEMDDLKRDLLESKVVERAEDVLPWVEKYIAEHHPGVRVEELEEDDLADGGESRSKIVPAPESIRDSSAAPAVADFSTAPAAPAAAGVLGNYTVVRQQFLVLAHALVELLEEPELADRLRHGDVSLTDRARHRIERVEGNRFRIGIVGEFSSGKSTLLNAILNSKILPASIRPTTAVVNTLRWGAQPRLIVEFTDGHSTEAPLESLKDYVTERKNPGNKRGVAQVTIEAPVQLLEDGVELVDTPGISSLFEAHTRITYELIPQCDAVLLIASARQPFSESIGSFLDDLHGFVNGKVFYVLNKIDQLEPAGLAQAIEFARQQVSERVEGARVFGLSAYAGLAGRLLTSGEATATDYDDDPRLGELQSPDALIARSRLPDLENTLGTFLARTRGIPLLREQAIDLVGLLEEAEQLLQTERQAASMSLEERRSVHKKLTTEHSQRCSEATTALRSLQHELASQLAEIRASAIASIREATPRVIGRIPVNAASIESAESLDALKDTVRSAVRTEAMRTAEIAVVGIRDALQGHSLRARIVLRELQSELRSEFRGVMGLDDLATADGIDFGGNLNVEAEGWGEIVGNLAIGGVLGFLGGFFLGPIGVGLAFFGGNFVEQYFREGRVEAARAQVQKAVGHSLTTIVEQLSARLDDLNETVTRDAQEELDSRGAEILAEFDSQLAALASQVDHQQDEDKSYDRRVRSLQAQSAELRGQMSRLLISMEERR